MRVAEIEKIRDLVVGGVPPACRRHDDDAARGVCKHDLAHAGKARAVTQRRAAEFCDLQHKPPSFRE